MENPAKLLCQNKGRDMNDKTMKCTRCSQHYAARMKSAGRLQ